MKYRREGRRIISALSLRLPQSGSDTLVCSVPLLHDPAHMFFLDTFFLDSFPEVPHPLFMMSRGETGAQLPWRVLSRSGVRGEA